LDLARSELGSKFVQGAGRAYYAAGRTIRGIFGAARGDAGDQRWQALSRPWLGTPAGVDRTRGTPEPLFQKRVLRPQRRADARLVLVDLDLRQVELAVQAGSSFPRASAGVPGDGRTPRDPESFRRIVAVFNAGPEAPYDRYGTMAAGRVLVPAIEGEPGVYVDTTRGPVIERFPWGKEVPASVTGFEQRRTLLVENGLAVPAAGAAERSVRRRSALCTPRSGGLFSAFADALDAGELAGALIQAGCRSAIPLATGPERLGFALADFDRADQGRFELVDAAMNLEPALFATGSSRDFFYVLARDGQPKSPPGVRWAPDSGTQPPPAWLPGILRAELTLGALRIDLVSIAWGGVGYRLRAGGSELGAKGEPWVGVLADDERARALAAVELGHATTATRYGLALGTTVPLALKPAYATLVLGDGAPPRILLPSEPVTLSAGEHAVQLPLLADDGDVTARARERGDARLRSALGVTPDGRVVIALLRHDSSDPLAVALRNAGCRRVVELDRGSHHPAFVGRAGADSPLPEDPKTTTLWVLAKQAPASGQ
ncbi:MAG TPA: hypothetical protein VGK73_20035, partial [Polyangiaceae bacterium]